MIYLGTVPKTLAPGLRGGWMVAPPALIERFESARQSLDLMTGALEGRDTVRLACSTLPEDGIRDARRLAQAFAAFGTTPSPRSR